MRDFAAVSLLALLMSLYPQGAEGQAAQPTAPPSDSLVSSVRESSQPSITLSTIQSDVERAKQSITEGRFDDALAASLAAQKANPDSFEAAYYLGMAHLGLRQFDAAQVAAQRAYSLAPSGSQQQVEKLVSTIAQMRSEVASTPSSSAGGSVDTSEAEVALADGLVAKAARIYDSLYQGNKNAPELGLKAADLYANRLSQWADAGRLFNQVVRTSPESPEAEKANAELNRLQVQLTEAYTDAVMASFSQDWSVAAVSLRAASSINAKTSFPLWLTVSRAVEAGDKKAVQDAIVELAKRGPLSVPRLASIPGMNGFVSQPQFMQFLSDVVGSSGAQAIAAGVNSPKLAKPMLDSLIAKRELTFFIGSNCQTTCGASALYQVASIREEHRCSWIVSFGKPQFNGYTDQPTSWKVQWFKSAPVQIRQQFDLRVRSTLVTTEDVEQIKSGRFRWLRSENSSCCY